MITALVSAITGLVSGIVPDVVRMMKDGQDHKHEKELLELQHRFQITMFDRQAAAKVADMDSAATVADISAFREAVSEAIKTAHVATGIRWIDGFNAVLRPASAAAVLALFVFVALGFSDVIDRAAFSMLFIEMVQAVLGFLFGYRSARKVAAG